MTVCSKVSNFPAVGSLVKSGFVGPAFDSYLIPKHKHKGLNEGSKGSLISVFKSEGYGRPKAFNVFWVVDPSGGFE